MASLVAIVTGLGHKPGDFFGHMNALKKPCDKQTGLPWVLALTSLKDRLWPKTVSQANLFLSDLPFSHGVYHNNRE